MRSEKLLDLFNALRDAEQKLDDAVKRKKILVEEAHFKKTRKPMKIRLCLSMARTQAGSGLFLTIGGRVLDELAQQAQEPERRRARGDLPLQAQGPEKKRPFSALIKKLCVDLVCNTPADEGGDAPSHFKDLGYLSISQVLEPGKEKHGSESGRYSQETDGFFEWVNDGTKTNISEFEIKASAPYTHGRVFIEFANYEGHYSLCSELAELLGMKIGTKPAVLVALWKYVKINRLQDQKRGEAILCNERLRALFKKEEITFREITETLHSFMCPVDMLSIPFAVPSGANAKQQVAYDITLESNDEEKEYAYTENVKIAIFNKKINDILARIKKQDEKISALDNFIKDPRQFIVDWMLEYSKNLHIISDDLYDVDDNFYQQKEVQEGVYQLLQNYK